MGRARRDCGSAMRSSSRPCLTPRLPDAERPKYLDFVPFMFWNAVVPTLQVGFWATCVTQLSHPLYQDAATWWKEEGRSEETFMAASLTVLTVGMFFGYNTVYLAIERYRLLETYRIGRTQGQQKSTDSNFRFTLIRAAVGKLLLNPILVVYLVLPVMRACGS